VSTNTDLTNHKWLATNTVKLIRVDPSIQQYSNNGVRDNLWFLLHVVISGVAIVALEVDLRDARFVTGA
jgi:hypothetical protein